MFEFAKLRMSEFGMLWDQIRAERKSKELRKEEDYLIRGEPNHVLRWQLTLMIALAYVARVFFFTTGFYFITFLLGWYYRDELRQEHLLYETERDTAIFKDSSVHRASDWSYATDGESCEPCISAFFSHTLSSDDFDSLVHRILEFKIWLLTTRVFVVALCLTWLPFLKCSLIGPQMLLLWIVAFVFEVGKTLASYKSFTISFAT